MNARKKHYVCKAGACVRLHGYAPALVLAVYQADGATWAHCRVTLRRRGIGPHGFRPGELVNVRACHAIPRDLIRVSRQQFGRLIWGAFDVQVSAMQKTEADARYSIAREFCGHANGARYVARFCNEWLGERETKNEARALCESYEAQRFTP